MNTSSKLTVSEILQGGFAVGLKNALSIVGAVFLWLITFWIPYLNVGTTIAILSMPVALSKGKVLSPLFIFEGKYRKYMGEYFSLVGLMLLSIIPALLFFVVPAIVIAISWSLSVYILLDKGVSPSDAMVQSNKATFGHKWTIFLSSLVLSIAYLVLVYLFGKLGGFGSFLIFIVAILYQSINMGCQTIIYKRLVLDVDLDNVTIDDEKEPLF